MPFRDMPFSAIALLCLGPGDHVVEGYTARRLGGLLSRSPATTCVAVSPNDFTVAGTDVLIGRGLLFNEKGEAQEEQFDPPVAPDFVYYIYEPQPQRDVAARELLARISLHGVRTNYDPDASQLGVKSVLEERCREYEEASGRKIPRPRTIVIAGGGGKDEIVQFMRRVGPCIIKPHNESRSRGVGVLLPGESVSGLELGTECYVVQELVARPLLMDGFKTGLRVYLIVDDLKRSYSLSQVGLVKLAPAPYRVGDPAAEIVGPYEQRDGSWPTIYLLNELVEGDETRATWTAIRKSIDQTIDLFMEAVSWRAGLFHQRLPSTQIWGIDILVRETNGTYEAYLIEVNTFPQLYRGDAFTDAAVDNVVRYELFSK
jgi:Tubulin-tyrosine ligase family